MLKTLKKPKKSILSGLDFSGGKNTLFMDICNSYFWGKMGHRYFTSVTVPVRSICVPSGILYSIR